MKDVRSSCPVRRAGCCAALILMALLAGAGSAGALEPSVPLARDATARSIIDDALRSIAARQRESGLFDDQTGRVVGGEGLPSIAYVALARARELGLEPAAPSATAAIRRRQSAATPAPAVIDPATTPATPGTGGPSGGAAGDGDPPADTWLLTLARRTLAKGSGSSVILRWPLAMTLGAHLESLLVGLRGELRARALVWARLHAAGIAADVCYQRPSCFNNYKIADAVLNLELARSGLRSTVRHTRLRDPLLLRRRAVRYLSATLPRFAPPSGRLAIPGRPAQTATILSDPGTRPLAYAALCTAWAVRGARLAGKGAPVGLRRLARRALLGLLGVTGPDGELSWSGRGQGQAWTHAASLYAAAGGAALFADSDPLLAARLRRLADVQLAALGARMRGGVLQVLPSGNAELAGLDHYYSVTGSTGLALAFLQMARGDLPDPKARRLELPAEIDGASYVDPGAETGLVTRRSGLSWMGLRMRRSHPFDPRSDAGLLRAVRLVDGRWREQLPERPGPLAKAGTRTPSGGPVLVLGATHLQPRAGAVQQLFGGVDLHGTWTSAGGGSVPGTWRYSATAAGVALRSTCPLGARLELTAWLPRRGALVRDGGLVERAGYAVRAAPRPSVRPLVSGYANSVQPSLRAYRLVTPCSGPFASLTWSGGASTPITAPPAATSG